MVSNAIFNDIVFLNADSNATIVDGTLLSQTADNSFNVLVGQMHNYVLDHDDSRDLNAIQRDFNADQMKSHAI